MTERAILVAAGGTGGHLFPAEALSHALIARGLVVELATDERADRYGASFPARRVHLISAATVTGRSPGAILRTASSLGLGLGQSLSVVGGLKPAVAIGFGGYPTVPPLAAAILRRVPTIIHEQNAVLGWGNRLLARYVTAIATGFPKTAGVEAYANKLFHVGNPVRPAVVAAAASGAYAPPAADGPIRLLVFGGSQGARVFADVVPDAMAALPAAIKARLSVVQQTRAEDLERVRAGYAAAGVSAELAPFFTDLPARMAAAHLVVARSGASTVAELAAIGRPSLLVPLPHARDNDQALNAAVVAGAGGAVVVPQAEFLPVRLAGDLTAVFADPARLAAMAVAARGVGAPDAVDRLADLVLRIAEGDRP